MLGDVKPEEGFPLARKYFGDIPAGAAPVFADPSEPEQTEERCGTVEEKFGTLPALAVGYPVPQRRTKDWCAMALLDQALHGGRAGRVYYRLVLDRQVAVEADGGIDDLVFVTLQGHDCRVRCADHSLESRINGLNADTTPDRRPTLWRV